MVVGDGAFVRAALEGLLDFLRRFASPTGARGSVLLMMGGLIVLGFLFMAFVFRSAIVGDLAPVANARRPLPRVRLPGESTPSVPARSPPSSAAADSFLAGRTRGRTARPTMDAVFETLIDNGVDARILQSGATSKRVRVYDCPSCRAGRSPCEAERGLLAGAFEALTTQLAKVDEVACVGRGDPCCEFEVRHAALVRVGR